MHLKALRLKGFKSFPKQTELLFEPGVAVIIGPNGSGKSNIADAVVWALGEQSPSSVRGSSMQDVIFAGSDGRRAGGSAEVELTFDNADGALPLPVDEVSVMRRVARDGSSQYSINQSGCRLTDVVELMAQVGLGKELHSIIGQGKVESFLAGKPEDRRDQIEEAAGLGTFKRRRERAELKLREVRRNLERADLLEREVSSQLAPLRRQASAAEQLRSVEATLAETRGRLLTGEVGAVDVQLSAQRDELAVLQEERARGERGLEAIAAARAGEEEAFARRLADRERRAKRLLRARVLDGRLESGRRLTEQRQRLLEEVERASAEERTRLLGELAGRPEESEEDRWPQEERRLAEALEAAEAAYAEVAGRLAAARELLGARRASLSRLTLDRESALTTAARLERRQEALAGEEARLAAHYEALLTEAATKSGAEESSVAAETLARDALRDAGAAAEAAAGAAAASSRLASAAEERHRALLTERRALEANVDHLRAALRDLQDVGADVLRVADAYPGTVSLAGAISCEAGYELALAAALAQVSGALAVPRGVDHWSLLSALKSAGVGLVRLVVPPARPRPSAAFPGAAPLIDRVSLEGRDELESALADVVIVDDLHAVPDGFSGLAVTLEGEFYRPSSGHMGLASGVPAALLLERRAALKGLSEKLDAVRSREVREAAALTIAVREQEDAREAAEECAAAERQARIAAETAERDLKAVRERRRDLDDVTARERRAREGLASERAETGAELEAAAEAAAAALLAAEQLRPEADAAEAGLAVAEGRHAEALSLVTRRRVELEERRAAAQRAAAEREAARSRAVAGRARLKELERRLEELPEVRDICAALAARVTGLSAHARMLIERLDPGEEADASVDRGQLRALAEQEAGLRRDLADLGERRTAVQVALARLEDRRAELATALDEVSEQLDQAGFAPPADADEARELRERLERLSRRRERIGPVNPLAEAECAELGERAAFLREQRRDLEKSLDELGSLIKELTAQIDAEFAGTFAAVQEQFEHMVAVLFPGGRGSLKLAEPGADDPGGVTVQVKPAKKLGKKLQLLSGGERALVAIAFLMALVLARPCPFYILDEIEAALDDVNIGRLVKLLRDYRERTQFIMITHQKRTMEAADVLYGVTMGADGGSQVVSARMAQEEIERQERAKGKAGEPPAAGPTS
ncbi:MAG: chromosome segregation protein SMC [Actinobacteria bacterium]|nr:chromosome segregation protein SMC [Actinomycetota bacterium]